MFGKETEVESTFLLWDKGFSSRTFKVTTERYSEKRDLKNSSSLKQPPEAAGENLGKHP